MTKIIIDEVSTLHAIKSNSEVSLAPPEITLHELEVTPYSSPIVNGDPTLSGEEVIWNMIVKSTQITKMRALDRVNYDISRPVQVSEDNPKLYEVTITNVSDTLYKLGSTSTLRYFKHDMAILDDVRFRKGVEATSLSNLLELLSTLLKTKLTLDDVVESECYEDDGYWYIKAKNDSWYFIEGTEARVWNRSKWPTIFDWLPVPDLGYLKPLGRATKSTDEVFYQNLVEVNVAKGLKKPIDLSKIEVAEFYDDANGRSLVTLDRKEGERVVGPETYYYSKIPLTAYITGEDTFLNLDKYQGIMFFPAEQDEIILKDDPAKQVTLSYYLIEGGGGRPSVVTAGGTGSSSYFYLYTNRSGIDASVTIDFLMREDGEISLVMESKRQNVNVDVGSHCLYVDGVEVLDIPHEKVLNVLIVKNGSRITVFFNDVLEATTSGSRVSIGDMGGRIAEGGQHHTIVKNIDVRMLVDEETAYPTLDYLETGTVYQNLNHINDYFGVNLTEDDIEDGPVEAGFSQEFSLVAKNNHLVLKGGSKFLIVRAPFMYNVFKVTDLRGFSPNPALVGHGTGITTRKFVYDDGIRTLSYYGALETDEFIQPAEVHRLTNVGGSIAYPETRWHKFELDGKYVYVPEKPIAGNVNANTLKARNMYFETEMRKEAGLPDTYRVNTLQYDGETYKVRILKTFPGTRLTAPDPTTEEMRMDYEPTHGSEWNRLYYPIAQTAVNYSHHNVNKLDHKTSQVEPQWDELELQRDLAMVPNTTMSAYSVTQGEIASGNTYRGAYGVSRLWAYSANSSTNVLGFRPILIHMPALKEHYKIKFSTFAKFETIEWDDYENIDLDYCKDLYLEHRPIDTDMEWTEEKVTMEQGKLLFILGRVHSGKELRIRHTDGNRTFYSTTLRSGWIQDHYEYAPGRFAGPGPQTLKRVAVGQVDEDLLIGYFGTVPSSEFLTTAQLKALLKSNLGGDGNITTWHKFLYGGRVCYIPQEYLHAGFYGYSLSSNNLRNGQIVNHEGHDYTVRAIKSTVSGEPLKFADIGGYDPVVTHGSEWNELVYRIVYSITGHNPFPDIDDRWNNVSESDFYSYSSGSYNAPLMYELSEEGPRVNLLARGGDGVAKIRYLNNNYGTASSLFSYKPIIYLGREPDYELIKDVQRANLRFVHDDMNETITLVNYLKVFSNYARTLKLIDEYGTVKDFSVPSTAFTSGDPVYYTGDWELKGRVKVLTNFGTRLLTIGWFTIGEGPKHIVTNPWVGEAKDEIRTPSYNLYNSGHYRVWDRIDKQDSADYSDILYLRHGGGRYTNGDRGTYASQQRVTVDSNGTMTVAEHTLVRYGNTNSLGASSPYAVQGICLETPVFESDDQAIIYTFDLPAVAGTSVIRAVYSQVRMYATTGSISSLGLSLSSVGNRIVYRKNGTFEIYVGSRQVYVADISELRNNAIFIGHGTNAYLNRTTKYAISIANLRVSRLKTL